MSNGIRSQFLNRMVTQEGDFLDNRRLRLAKWYVVFLTLGILLDLFEISGAFDTFFKYTNSVMLGLMWVWVWCYVAKKINILFAVSLLSATTQIFIAIDTIYCIKTPAVVHMQMVVWVNILILIANIMFSIATYQKMMTPVNVAITIVTFFLCMVIVQGEESWQYLAMAALIFVYIGLLGLDITRSSQILQNENSMIKQEEEELMHVLQMNKEQLRLYIQLAKEEHSEDETRLILSQFSEKTQKYVVDNVLKFINSEKYREDCVAKALPELTPSERNIAILILKGHRLGSICTMLNKTESNINTQRANMRRKLGLLPDDNLGDVLKLRMEKTKL